MFEFMLRFSSVYVWRVFSVCRFSVEFISGLGLGVCLMYVWIMFGWSLLHVLVYVWILFGLSLA